VVAAVVVLGVTTVLAVLGAVRTGVTTDEPIHVMRLRNYFDTGWYALDWDFGGAGPGGDGTNTFVYAPVTMLLLHAWSVLWGVESWGDVATSPHAYDVRHLGVVVIGLVGVAAVAVLGRVVLRHWRWGLVAAAALAALPLWTGHEMFNVKDVPVATGYTLATLGLALHVRAERPGIVLVLARACCLVAGLVLALGTRPGMWSGLLAVLVVAVPGVVRAAARVRVMVASLAEMLAACVVAAGVLVAVYPRLFGSPLRALPRTTESSSSFLSGEKSDRLYVPRHLAEEVPTLLLAFALTGAVVGVSLLWRHWRDNPVQAGRIALVGVQAFALPLVAIAVGSDLYHGLRQLLFMTPALAVLAAYGMAWVLARPRPWCRHRRRWIAATALAVASLVLPAVDEITLQPYQTTYVNLATDLVTGPFAAPDERPGGDFWRVSVPELVEHVRLDRQLLCKAMVDKQSDLAYRFANGGEAFSTIRSLDCREEANGPLAPQGLPVVRRPPPTQYDAVFLKTLPANCRPRNEVRRWRHGFEVVLSLLGRCTTEVPTLTGPGVWFADPALGTAAPTDLWRFAVDGWEQRPHRSGLTAPVPLAELTFRPTGPCGDAGCTLVVDGTAPPDLVATVDGGPVVVGRDHSGTLAIPITAAQVAGADGVWLTLSRRSGQTLGMRLNGLSLRPPTTTKGLG
jgi:hypothetical protein